MNSNFVKPVYIFVDFSNFHYYLSQNKWRINWKKFHDYMAQSFGKIEVFYYDGILSNKSYLDRYPADNVEDFNEYKKNKEGYFRSLKTLGFKVRTKPVGSTYDSTSGKKKHKCNFDVELTVDAIDNLNNYDEMILCSGDGDFVRLLKYLKGKYKKTIVLAPGDRLNSELEKTANQTLHLGQIRQLIEDK